MSEVIEALKQVEADLRSQENPERADSMAAYMKDHFVFLGVPSPARKAAQKPLMAAARTASRVDVLAVADLCWHGEPRELQYIACELLRRRANVLEERDLDQIKSYISRKSWWDTVDALAAHVVGPMVAAFPDLAATMDTWIHDDDIWIARTAILHQLRYKTDTDEDRLFHYAEVRAADTEFFIRKALGWALREYAKVEPHAVLKFVESHDAALSGLTKREATKHL